LPLVTYALVTGPWVVMHLQAGKSNLVLAEVSYIGEQLRCIRLIWRHAVSLVHCVCFEKGGDFFVIVFRPNDPKQTFTM